MKYSDQEIKKGIGQQAGNIVYVTCIDLDDNGNGIGRYEDEIFIVPDLLPLEIGCIKLVYKKGNAWVGKLLSRKKDSQYRRLSNCSYSEKCGSCSLINLEYKEQLEIKQNKVDNALKRIGGIARNSHKIISILKEEYGYRNRALIPIKRSTKGKIIIGYYEKGTHEIVDIDDCIVLEPRLSKYILPIKNELQETNLGAKPDNEVFSKIRHIGLRIGSRTGDVLITIICNHNCLQSIKPLADKWYRQWEEVKGITLNVQPEFNNKIFGKKTFTIAGENTIKEIFCELELLIGSTTFFQINTALAEFIVNKISNWFDQGNSTKQIIDAYCGLGTISLPLARNGRSVIGIDISHESIQLARLNAIRNHIHNVHFVKGNVERQLENYLTSNHGLVVDPPRKGLSKEILEIILRKLPSKIAYLSCKPSTLARDLKLLTLVANKYDVESIQPIDFFPQTTHVECLVLLTLKH